MGTVEKVYILYYVSKDFRERLTNINLLVKNPRGELEGLFMMNEFDSSNYKGIYKYEYTPSLEGTYLFSVFEGNKFVYSKSEYFNIPEVVTPTTIPVIKLRPVAGFDS